MNIAGFGASFAAWLSALYKQSGSALNPVVFYAIDCVDIPR